MKLYIIILEIFILVFLIEKRKLIIYKIYVVHLSGWVIVANFRYKRVTLVLGRRYIFVGKYLDENNTDSFHGYGRSAELNAEYNVKLSEQSSATLRPVLIPFNGMK